jgi:isocitrate dehydrogenase
MNYEYERVDVPEGGEPIEVVDEDADQLDIPENPIVPIIHGDGIGKDVGPAAQRVLDAAAAATGRNIEWMRVYAGGSARERYDGENLPDDTVNAIDEFRVAIKGPLTTPVGAGFRSLNVALRQTLDFYANVRPTYYLDGVPSPMKAPEEMDMVTFRENTEDVYAGIEWEQGTEEVEQVRAFVEDEMGFDDVMHDGPIGLGLKPITETGSKRLVRKAIDYALEHDRDKVTLVHKGNIMKFTEGQFGTWGMEVADEEYPDDEVFAAPDSLWETQDEVDIPEDAVMVEERLADAMLQWMQLRTDEFDVLAMPNLNGDYLSDAAGAQIGGLGIAPGANFGDARVLAEPVHGSAPKRAGKDQANPTALILSGRLMFDYMGWKDAADIIYDAVETTISSGTVTYDLERNLEDAEKVSTTAFADAVIDEIERLA